MDFPPEILRHIARMCHPACRVRNLSKGTRALVTVDDLTWAEAGWRAFTGVVNNIWALALHGKHVGIAKLYVRGVSREEAEWGLRIATRQGLPILLSFRELLSNRRDAALLKTTKTTSFVASPGFIEHEHARSSSVA